MAQVQSIYSQFCVGAVTLVQVTSCKVIAGFAILILVITLGGCGSQKSVRYQAAEKRLTAWNGVYPEKRVKITLERLYLRWKGVRYRNGGDSQRGIDCSAFIQMVYKELYNIPLPRTVRAQAEEGKKVGRSRLQPGDLVFFKTGLFSKHVGIYYQNNHFIHASSRKGVVMSNLLEPYWHKRFWQARRL